LAVKALPPKVLPGLLFPHSPVARIMHKHAVVADVEDMFSIDFDVVNRLAGFPAGERFKFPSRVIREPQVFADSQFSSCDELLSIFAPE
jgi:hypothetical protein